MKNFKFLVLFICIVLRLNAALACQGGRPQNFEDLKTAEIIFSGKIENYIPVHNTSAKLWLKVTKNYKGQTPTSIRIVWANSTFGIPDNILQYQERYGREVLIALVEPPEYRENTPGEEAGFNEMLHVLQAGCSSPFMFSMQQISEDKQLKENLSKYIDLEE